MTNGRDFSKKRVLAPNLIRISVVAVLPAVPVGLHHGHGSRDGELHFGPVDVVHAHGPQVSRGKIRFWTKIGSNLNVRDRRPIGLQHSTDVQVSTKTIGSG